MSWNDGVPAAALSTGPLSSFAAAAAASTSAQSLVVGATGDFYLPVVPAGFVQPGKPGQLLIGQLAGVCTMSTTSTTMTVTVGLNSSAATAGGSTAPTTTALFSAVVTPGVTTANIGWMVNLWANVRVSGYGTTSVSTSLMTSGVLSVAGVQSATNATAQPVSTIDNSVAQYLWATVTFSTSSATNSATCQQANLYGMS